VIVRGVGDYQQVALNMMKKANRNAHRRLKEGNGTLHPNVSFFCLVARMELAKHPPAFELTADFSRSWSSDLTLVM
jgi:hypothetical protein